MSRILALDIGMRRTGVAYLDEETAVPLPLDTIAHRTTEELLDRIGVLVAERKIDSLVVGLPLLPSGQEGAQATYVRTVAEQMTVRGFPPLTFRDERYTTPRSRTGDPDASAALNLL